MQTPGVRLWLVHINVDDIDGVHYETAGNDFESPDAPEERRQRSMWWRWRRKGEPSHQRAFTELFQFGADNVEASWLVIC